MSPTADNPKVKARYQRLVVRPLLNAIDYRLQYTPERGLPYSDLKRSQLASTMPFSRYVSDNFISYKNKGIPVAIANVSLMRRGSNSNSFPGMGGLFNIPVSTAKVSFMEQKSNGDDIPVMQGLLCVTNVNRKIEGSTIVTLDPAEKHLGFLGQAIQPDVWYGGLKKVYLDNTAFEKKFAVYSSDPVEANYLLSFTVMQALVQLSEKYNVSPHISFMRDKMYIMLDNHNLFEATDYSFETAEKSIRRLFFIMEAIKAIHEHHEL